MVMSFSKSNAINFIDKAIFVFIVLFLISLTNSIFVNQLGYFGALLLLLVKSIITKKNVFRKTGLETALFFMIAAEILSTIFSVNRTQSLQFFLKFFLLLPILYTIDASTNNIKTAKLYFKIFIGGALASCLIYLYLAYDYVIYNQFQIQQSGPSPFQYPITASELISFVVVFLFSFAISEKVDLKKKLVLWLLFFISSAALLSIYKRTGWMGTFAGIVFMLIYLKRWKIVLPMLLLMVAAILFEKNESDIFMYRFQNSALKQVRQIKTEGRVKSIDFDSGTAIVSDYENGFLATTDFKTFSKTAAPSAVIAVTKWKNYYCALLCDSRFVLYSKTADKKYMYKSEFISPGYISSFAVANGFLYAADIDSGVTIFKDPENLKDTVRIPSLCQESKIKVDSSTFSKASFKKLEVFKLKDNIPQQKIVQQNFDPSFSLLEKINDKYFIVENGYLAVYELANDSLNFYASNKEIQKPCAVAFSGDSVFVATLTNEVIVAQGDLKILSQRNIGRSISNIYYKQGDLFVTHLIQGRLSSFVDKYNQSNFTRFALWRAGWNIFLNHPVFGVGNIDLADLYLQYKRPMDKEVQGHMHNNFVHILVTLGLVGISALLFLFVTICKRLHQIFTKVKNVPFVSSYTVGVLGGVVSFIVAGLTEWNFGDHEIITMVWFTVGLAVAFSRTMITQNSEDSN